MRQAGWPADVVLRIRDSFWQHEADSDTPAEYDQLLRTLDAIAPNHGMQPTAFGRG
jgi:hypothetical protein